jgi:hypothetical protein
VTGAPPSAVGFVAPGPEAPRDGPPPRPRATSSLLSLLSLLSRVPARYCRAEAGQASCRTHAGYSTLLRKALQGAVRRGAVIKRRALRVAKQNAAKASAPHFTDPFGADDGAHTSASAT